MTANDRLQRAAHFESCRPNREWIAKDDFVRLMEAGDEVIVTYDLTRTVYLGWDLG